MLRVGLTGGIASGKSRVLERFAAAGFVTLDLDRVAHDVMAPGGTAHAAVLAAFGPGVRAADGSIDRKKLGPIVFGDAGARERLNAIVHPCVREEETRRLAAAPAGAGSVSDAALLVESGGHLRYDRLVVVWCSPEEQLRRLRGRDGLTEGAARERIAAQMPAAEKRRFGHFEIDSGGSLDETAARARALAAQLGELARRPAPKAGLVRERSEAILANNPGPGPRGLDGLRLLDHLAGEENVELKPLAALLDPPADGPWYRAARAAAEAPGPELLAAPLALFCLARRGFDRDFLAGAAASLARLTHRAPEAVATGVLAALVVGDALQAERGVESSIEAGLALAQRWGDAPPGAAAVRALASRLLAPGPPVTPELSGLVGRLL